MTLHHGATVAGKMSSDHSWTPIFLTGLYDTQHSQPGHEVSDFVISPYLPTLRILAQPLNPSGVDSGLCLADGRCLKLRDIAALSRPHGGLAFLSVRSTLRLRQDCCFDGPGFAPDVARDVYEQLFRNTRPDYQDAARTLHEALRQRR
ncbi:hypothetical protein L210DRAFT_3569197, partial [Boletus edulis BED1]